MRALSKFIGKRVTLTLKNTSATRTGPFKSMEGDTFELTGMVLDPRHNGCYRENDLDIFFFSVPFTEVPIRVIDVKRVVAIDGIKMIHAPAVTKEYQIEASKKGTFYKVTCRDGRWSCQCSAFGFRHTCRHITEAKEIK